LIDADISNISGITKGEDMVVVMCYIAECHTFGRVPEFDSFDIDFYRKHIVHVLLNLANLY
jgi:hypothetical protein